jgi:hypothetical protein
MKNIFILVFFTFPSFTLPAFAASLACDYNPARNFKHSYSGLARDSIRDAVEKLTENCEQVADSKAEHDEWIRSFSKRCSALCIDRLGSGSDGGKCLTSCNEATVKIEDISRAYFRGVNEGTKSCLPKASESSQPKAVQ